MVGFAESGVLEVGLVEDMNNSRFSRLSDRIASFFDSGCSISKC